MRAECVVKRSRRLVHRCKLILGSSFGGQPGASPLREVKRFDVGRKVCKLKRRHDSGSIGKHDDEILRRKPAQSLAHR